MKRLPVAIAAAVLALPAQANDLAPAMRAYVSANVMAWASDPVVLAAIRAGNADHAGATPEQIQIWDQAWRAEVGTGLTPTIAPVVNNALSDFLRLRMAASGGTITEVFVMDDKGLLVGTSGITSDYWQADEEKWSLTFAKGPGAVHVGDVELDESSQTWQGQISFSLVDPATGMAIGAMTVGLDADAMR